MPNVRPGSFRPASSDEKTQRAKDEVRSHIVASEGGRKIPSFDQVYTMVKDDLHPIRVLRNELLGPRPRAEAIRQLTSWAGLRERLPIERDPYRLARLTRGSGGRAEQMIENGTFDFDDQQVNGEALKPILDSVADDLDGFREYIVARRALEFSDRGLKSGIDRDTAQTVVDAGDRFVEQAEKLVDYQSRVLGYLRDSGIISDEAFDAMQDANRFYVPFYRLIDPESDRRGPGGRDLKTFNPVKRVKGSERPIIDPIESIIKNTYLHVALAEKNRVLQAIDDLAATSPLGGELWHKAKRSVHPIKVDVSEVAKFLEEHGLDPDDAESFTIFRPNAFRPSRNEISFYRNGKREIRQVDPDVAEAINNLDRENLNLLEKIIALPARALRAGAVLAPEFIVRNPVRDQFSAFILSKSGYVPVYDTLLGLKAILQNEDAYQKWLTGAGAQSTLVSVDRDYIDKNVHRLSDPTYIGRFKNVVSAPLDFLRMTSELLENATRVGNQVRSMRSGKTPMEAAYEARELTLDFARIGSKMKAINAIIPFFNAQVEGVDRMVRSFGTRPLASALKVIAAITVPSVALWFVSRDDDRVKELPRWEKDLFWIVPTDSWNPYQIRSGNEWRSATDADMKRFGKKIPSYYRKTVDGNWEVNSGTLWRIPKPFEIGVLFGSVPERVLDAYLGDRPRPFKHLLDSVSQALLPSYIPTIALPIIEQFANRSTFTDRQIVPKYLEGVNPEYQYGPYTSEVAKKLGAAVARIAGDQSQLASPMVIDNYIRAWTGGMGMHAVGLADRAMRAAGLAPSKIEPTWTSADTPVLKAFAARFPEAGAQSIQDFYDEYQDRTRISATVKFLAKTDRREQSEELRKSRALDRAENIHKAIGKQLKFVRDVWNNKDISPDDKRHIIDNVYRQAIELAKRGLDIFERTSTRLSPSTIRKNTEAILNEVGRQ